METFFFDWMRVPSFLGRRHAIVRCRQGEQAGDSAPLSIDDFTHLFETLQTTVADLRGIVVSADEEDAAAISTVLDQFTQFVQGSIDLIFWRLFILIAFMGGICFVLLFIHFKIKQKNNKEK